MSKKILILYHSQGGNTLQLAHACKKGVEKEEDIEVKFLKAFDTKLEDIQWADGIIIATPEYFGNMSGAVKDFFDRTYYPARNNDINIPFALIICCENDGMGAERYIQGIASSYILRKTIDTLNVKEKDLNTGIADAEELGQTFAAGLSLGIF